MAELGMRESDLPPTIPESSPPHTPVQSPEDKFTLLKGTPVQTQEVCINVNNDPLCPKKRDSSADKSPAFMLISHQVQSQVIIPIGIQYNLVHTNYRLCTNRYLYESGL